MRAVVQRVLSSEVTVDGQTVGKIGKGLMVLIGVEDDDHEDDIKYTAEKIVNLRIFDDNEGKLNLSLLDIGGEALCVSQFTLLGDARKGRRPSYITAADPKKGKDYYKKLCGIISDSGVHVEEGIFQADMKVSLINDGPVTILLDSKKSF